MEKAPPPLWQAVLSGCAGGLGSTLVGHPLETIKANLQMGKSWRMPIGALWKGLAAPLMGNVPFWGSYIVGYRIGERYIKGDSDKLALQLAAGAFGGTFSCIVLTPVDAIKVVAQVEQISTAAAFRKLLKERQLYRALIPTVGRMAPSTAFFFLTYSTMSELGYSPFVCGGMAGVVEWTMILPVDTIKTRYTLLADQPLGTVVRDIYAKGGVRGFYSGMVPTLARSFPANGAAFMCIAAVEGFFEDR